MRSSTYSAPYSLGCRKWVVIPKETNARTTETLRDLVLHNVTRKFLARMCNSVIDEVFRSQAHSSQLIFCNTSDNSHNLVLLHRTFEITRIFSGVAHFIVNARMEYCKTYYNVGWTWLRRCLAASRLPTTLKRVILAFLPGMNFLVFRGVATTSIQFLSGLAQGYPLSCYLFLLIVDPLLHRIAQVD